MLGIKQFIKNFLIKRSLYNNLKYSFLFSLYQKLFKQNDIKNHKAEVIFYRSFLSSCDLVFDIGAYDGHKTAAFLEISDRVISCEPDNFNNDILRTRFRRFKKRVFIEPVAVSDKAGEEIFYVHHKGSAFNTFNPRWKEILEADKGIKWNKTISFSEQSKKVSTVTLDDLIKKYGKPYFIKIDVEGSEEKVLQGLSHPIPFLSFESLLPDFRTELLSCLGMIQSLNSNAVYNIAANEKLLFPSFIAIDKLHEWISDAPIHHFEVIVKMQEGI